MVLQGLTTRRARSTAALMSLNSSSTLSTPRISRNTCSAMQSSSQGCCGVSSKYAVHVLVTCQP